MEIIFALLKISIRLRYKSLFDKLFEFGKKLKDPIFTEASDWILQQYNYSNTFPEYNYFLDRFPLFRSIGEYPDEKESYFHTLLDDLLRKKDVDNIREDLMKLSKLLDNNPEDAEKILAEINKKAGLLKSAAREEVFYVNEKNYRPDYEASLLRGGMLLGINALDEHLRGLKFGTMSTIFGYTGSCKTTLAMSAVYYNAVVNELNSAYITLEVPKMYLKYMFLSRHSIHPKFAGKIKAIRYKDIFDGALNDQQLEDLDIVEDDLTNSPEYGKIAIFDLVDFASGTIETKITDLKEEIDICVLDYIQLIKFQGGNLDPKETMNYFTKKFHDFSQTYHDGRGFAALLLSQANREGWARAAKNQGRYDLRGIAEGNEIERSSFNVISLYSTDKLKAQNIIKCQLLKYRGGPTLETPISIPTDLPYAFIGDTMKLDSYDDIIESLI